MKKRFAIIGLGHFGLNLSLHLTDRGAEVLAIDNDESHIEKLRDRVAHVVIADAKDQKTLRSLGLEDMDGVIVSIGEDFESSILATANLQEIGVKKIINRVVSPVHEKLLRMMNVNELVLPESDAAYQLANRLTMSGVLDCLELTEEFSIVEVNVPKAFLEKNLDQVDLRKKYGLNLVTIMRRSESHSVLLSMGERQKVEVVGVPDADYTFAEGDILVLFGSEKDIERLPE